jgi:alkylation response protein AidB-like acyl-CoA dehydrogenase
MIRRYLMDFRLSEEQLMMQRLVKDFVEKEVKPVAKEYDSKIDPIDCVSWDLARKAHRLGFQTYPIPSEYGGGGMTDHVTHTMMQEELSVGDMGFAHMILQTARVASWLCKVASKEQIEEFIPRVIEDPDYHLALACTSPNHGTDNVFPDDFPGRAVDMIAEKKGDEYILNGTKHWVSNVGVAKLYLVYARTKRDAPISQAMSIFLMPVDTPGFSVARIQNKMGRRMGTNGELVFDNVRIPARYLLGEESHAWDLLKRQPMAGGCPGAMLLGVMRALYEETLAFAQTRIQGGVPIIQHQSIAVRLADMRAKIVTTRLLHYKTSWDIDNNCAEPGELFLTAGFQRDSALTVAHHAMEVCASLAVDRDGIVEKLIRDVCSCYHDLGSSDINRLKSVRALLVEELPLPG